MRLDFSGAPEIGAPIEEVWRRLLDHEFVARCAPGVESVERLDDTHFIVISGLGVGSVRVRFSLAVELGDLQPPSRATLTARGRAPGSELLVESTVQLESLAQSRTRLSWTAAASVAGTVASVGARLLKGTAQRLAERFWEEFARQAAAAAPQPD